MPCATYRVSILGRAGGKKASATGVAAYGAGKVIRVVSAVVAASYLAGQTLKDNQLDRVFDYSTRDDVHHEQILTPEHAPAWAKDRERLWNEVEKKENRVNSQLARSFIIALPRELTLEQNIELVRDHLNKEFVSKGMVADFAIHNIPAKDGGDQPHLHVLTTLRGFNEDGTWQRNKNREWNGYNAHKEWDKNGNPIATFRRFDAAEAWRESWEKTQNEHLERAGRSERISMKSYKEQGIDKIPQIHLGPNLDDMERNGIPTEKGNYNRWVEKRNRIVEALKGVAQWLTGHEKPRAERAEFRLPEYTLEDMKTYHAKLDERLSRVDEPSVADMAEQARAERVRARGQAEERTERPKQTWREGARGDKPEAGVPPGASAASAARPRRVASPEDRQHYQLMEPFLKSHPWESRKDMMQFLAVTSKYMHQKKAEARRDVFDRLSGQRDTYRYRAVWQDRPLPHQGKERSRGGRER